MASFRLVCLLGVLFVACADDIPTYMCPSSRTTASGINIARLTVSSEGVDSTVKLQLVSSECHLCDLQNVSTIPANERNCSILVDTRWPVRMAIVSNDSQVSVNSNCTNGELDSHFEAGGIYYIYLAMKNKTINCQLPLPVNSPVDSNVAMYVTIGLLAALALLYVGLKRSRRLFWKMVSDVSPVMDDEIVTERDLGMPTNVTVGKDQQKERLKSLDTFRGISLVIMMFVNYGGASYWFFSHSKWNGLTVADLVFPWFIWIMGTALAYSFQSVARSNKSKISIFAKIVRRSIILFALGFFVSSSGAHNFTRWRFMGVLQRFALTYFVTASIHLLFMVSSNTKITSRWHSLQDISLYWKEWVVQLILVVIHTCLTFLLRVPGCPTGYLGPGGLAKDGPKYEDGSPKYNVSLCTGGAAGYIDRVILGEKLVYQHPTCAEIYETTVPYDPEGLLGTLTSCFLCFLGLQAGKILTTYRDPTSRVIRFLVWCIVLGTIAVVLCRASKNDGWIPVNKNLWSLSYILTMASMAFALFTFCYIVVDVYNIWTGAPFYYPGMNSIVVYVCHELFSQPFQTFWDITPKTHAISMLINIWDVTFWVLMSVYLNYKQIFIAV